jgi:hypothetical protein
MCNGSWPSDCALACVHSGLLLRPFLTWLNSNTTLYYCPQWVIQLRGMILGLSFPHLIEICSVLHCIPVHSGQNIVCCLGFSSLDWNLLRTTLYSWSQWAKSCLLLRPFLTWLKLLLTALYSCTQWAKSCPVACCLGLSSLDWILLYSTLYPCPQMTILSSGLLLDISSLDWILLLTTLYSCPLWTKLYSGL